MVIAGSDKATRRRSVRRQRGPSSSRVGADLRRAREKAGLSLDAVQDRTGIRRFDIEALEEGDLSRFADEKAVLIAVRRCAETLGLDAVAMTQSVGEQWRAAAESSPSARTLVGATTGPVAPTRTTGTTPAVVRPSAPASTVVGHLSRYPGDTTHLRAFTQTAAVPQVGRRRVAPALPPGLRFDTTDAVPVTWRGPYQPEPAPLALRVAVWTTVVLLTLGVAGMAVHHWRPAWLVTIHLVSPASSASRTPTSAGGAHAPAPASFVVETPTGPTSATMTVRSPAFAVVVTTQAPCWINVTSPTSLAPVFSATVPAGTTKSFTSSNGQLTVELGASHVVVTAQVLGRTLPNWSLTPNAAPFIMTFHSAT